MPSATAAGASEGEPLGPMNERGQYRYLVEFAEPGLLQSPGRIRGRRFEPRSADAVAQRAQLMAQQAEHLRNITSALGHTPEVSHYFLATRSAMAIWLTPREAGNLRALEGVASIERERVHRLMTYSGPWFIGAETVWTGAGVPGGTANRGEDAVVAIIDSGVDPDHPSFANDPSCGHGVDGGPDKLLSHVDCSLTDISGVCIGLLPFDTSGHGSHVASTAAGNHLPPTTDPPPQPFGQPVEISGVAPCARIRSYKACPDLLCPAAMTEAAMNNIIMDGDVDVMNYSITGGSSPWTDGDRHKLELVDAGVLVAAAAGNTLLPGDPTAGEVNHRGPWVLTVAASTHDGGGVGLPALSASGPGTPPPDTQFIPLTKGTVIGVGDVPDGVPFTGKPIRRAIDDQLQIDDHGCGPLPYTPGYYSGAVGMVLAGGGLVPACAFQTQVDLADAAGADMLIIRNNEPGSFSFSLLTEPAMPVYSISMAAGEALVEWIEQQPGATVSFDLVEGQGTGDVLAGFSLRGPTPSPLQNLTKPDLAAPGVSIYAASPGVSVGPITLPGNYEFLSGTSMASPHAAGAAALVRSAHPDWTVSEVRSALMMTAYTGGTKEDENTPWDADDVGSGRVDLSKAALAGLVMDESYENYLAADPEEGGDVRTLNIAALRDMNCVGSCSWTRTVRNTVPENTAWSISGASFEGGFGVAVSPDTLAFTGDDGETAEFTVTVTPTTELLDAVAFGVVVLSEAEGKSPDLLLTVAIKGAGEPQPPENLVFEDRFEQE